RRRVQPRRATPAPTVPSGVALRRRALCPRRAPARQRRPSGSDGRARGRLAGGRAGRMPPDGRHLGLLGNRRRARADPPAAATHAAARPCAVLHCPLRALLHRAYPRPPRAGRHRGRPGDGALRRDRPPLLPSHGARSVPERLAAGGEAAGRRAHAALGPPVPAEPRGARPGGGGHAAPRDPRLLRSRRAGGLRAPGRPRGPVPRGRQLFRALAPGADRQARADDRRLGHRLLVHLLYAGRAVAARRSPHAGRAPPSAAALPGGQPEAPLRLLRHRGPGHVQEPPLPRAHDCGASSPESGAVRAHDERGGMTAFGTAAGRWVGSVRRYARWLSCSLRLRGDAYATPPPPGVEERWIITADGVRLHAWYARASRRATPGSPTLLGAHGNGVSIARRPHVPQAPAARRPDL